MPRRIIRQEDWDPGHDERVEPHHNLEPHMPDPDWSSVLIHPDQKKMPVGDPTLWANTITTVIDNDPILGSTPRVIQGDQVVLAQASDQYARSWSLTGSLALPLAVWLAPGETVRGPFTPSAFVGGINVILQITLGIDKVTIVQQILLASNGGSTNLGLCNNQSTFNNGPYVPSFTDSPITEGSFQTRPFAAIGALVGNSISIRGIFARGGPIQPPAFDVPIPYAVLSCMITPYAPGQGM